MKKFLMGLGVASLLLVGYKVVALSEEGFSGLDVFTKILYYIEQDYVEEVDESKLLRGAIRGLLSSLDPHSVYMSPEIYKELKDDTKGVFAGVGVEITVRDGWLTVVAPVENSPAAKAGMQPGDRVLKINGVITKDLDLSEAVSQMRGSKGSKITLTLGRVNLKQPVDVTLERTVIRVPSVRGELLDKEFGYVRISSFQERTADDLRKNLLKLEKQATLKGVILDLRNNPGGLLDQAVDVCDLFLTSGVIVTTESRDKEVDRREAHSQGTQPNYPMIVLVNGGSASASEIVAGALQDQNRAVILGTRSFGKGSVQSVIELDDGSALKLTVARYFTPKGRSIQAEGIVPDIMVEPMLGKKEENKTILPRLREEDLRGHLKGSSEGKDEEPTQEVVVDYQKKVALDYLKSWEVFGRPKSGEGIKP